MLITINLSEDQQNFIILKKKNTKAIKLDFHTKAIVTEYSELRRMNQQLLYITVYNKFID